MDDENKDEVSEIGDENEGEVSESVILPVAEAVVPSSNSKEMHASFWTISVDESVNYGFSAIKGVLPYLLAFILMYIASISLLILSILSSDESLSLVLLILAVTFFVLGFLCQLALEMNELLIEHLLSSDKSSA